MLLSSLKLGFAALTFFQVWVDPAFAVGALADYGEVPANTKADLLASHLFPLAAPAPRAVEALVSLARAGAPLGANPDPAPLGWVSLGAVAAVFAEVTVASSRISMRF